MTRIFTNCRYYNKPDTEYYKCANTGGIRHGQTAGRRTRGEVNHGENISYTVHTSRTILTNPFLIFIVVIES